MAKIKDLPEKVFVEKELESIMPLFFSGRKNDFEILRSALLTDQWDRIAEIGHTLSGVCGSYGFDNMGAFGRLIEDFAAKKNKQGIQEILEIMEKHIQNVKIEYIN